MKKIKKLFKKRFSKTKANITFKNAFQFYKIKTKFESKKLEGSCPNQTFGRKYQLSFFKS